MDFKEGGHDKIDWESRQKNLEPQRGGYNIFLERAHYGTLENIHFYFSKLGHLFINACCCTLFLLPLQRNNSPQL